MGIILDLTFLFFVELLFTIRNIMMCIIVYHNRIMDNILCYGIIFLVPFVPMMKTKSLIQNHNSIRRQENHLNIWKDKKKIKKKINNSCSKMTTIVVSFLKDL